jgi:ATP-dependent RNA helicase DeaD
MARKYLRDAVRIEVGRDEPEPGDAPLVRQTAYVVPRAAKPAALGRVLDVESPAAAIVFCRTREEVDSLSETLNGRGYRAEALHGGMSQEQRDRVMGRLRNGTADLLVATDVAARGLDIDHLTHVVNYNVPSAPASYVHRIGRVGRAGREGVAITLAEPREHRMLKTIERVTGQQIDIEKVPSVADLRAKRMEMTRAALHESLLSDDLDHFRVVVETLTDEFDLMEIALAAVKLAHEASGAPDEDDEIPDVVHRPREDRPRDDRPRDDRPRDDRPHDDRPRDDRPRFADNGAERPPRVRPTDENGEPVRYKRTSGPSSGMARLFIQAGRAAGIRPQDIVGAIANESRLSGRDIGAIQIADRFSLVEVPADAADEVIDALRATTLKGRRFAVRRDRDTPTG